MKKNYGVFLLYIMVLVMSDCSMSSADNTQEKERDRGDKTIPFGVNKAGRSTVNLYLNPNAINVLPKPPELTDTGTISAHTQMVNNPNCDSYIKEVERKIKRAWFPPRSLNAYGVVVELKLRKDGNILSHRIKKSCGRVITDLAAKQAVVNAAPFKELPDDFPVPFIVIISFKQNAFM